MKKTLVDLTYFSFTDTTPDAIIRKCSSTIGFLEKLSADFSTYFVVRCQNSLPPIEYNSVKIHFFKGKTLSKWQLPFRFNCHIQSLNPDYILVHGFGTAHYLILLKLILPKTKILLQCNGFAPKPKGLAKIVFRCSNRFVDGYLFTGIANASHWYQSGILSKNKIIEVMEGSVKFSFKGNGSRKENSFLWVGRLDKNKDPLLVIKSFQKFLQFLPNATLTMVYQDGDLEQDVSQFISENNLNPAIGLKGFVAHQDLEKLYHENQFFVLGSHYEGSGYALLEAMACGCIPIVTNIPSFYFMTDEGNCGLLFSPNNEEELLTQLKHTREIDYDDYQQKVHHQFEKKLSFQAIANSIASAFQSL